jgi:hypothetical protein
MCIRCLLSAHSWETPSIIEAKAGSRPTEPLPPSDIHALYHTTGPYKGTPEYDHLALTMGFSYRALLGKLLYAYVTIRPNIGYAFTTLAKFATSPSKLHYAQLKGIAKYLCTTIDWGIIFWRSESQPNLPAIPQDIVTPDFTLPSFPKATHHLQLYGYINAYRANDLRQRRSTTGYAFMLAGSIIAYHSKTQSITATSSMEAKFLAAISAGKVACYLRSILNQLGFIQTLATPICEENKSAIKMVNADQPTKRSRHIDIQCHINIQYFTIQDWKKAGHLILQKIPGIINPSDALTKSIG